MAQKQEITILPTTKIRLRDGIYLNATVYKPNSEQVRFPVILSLTPHLTDYIHERGTYFARHDYVCVIVDVRGRGSSDGVFHPFMNESKDGSDVVEWLAKQPFCNGQVAMLGGSYGGYDQWATAKAFPPHLKTIVPVASVMPGIDFPMAGNIMMPYTAQWLTLTSGRGNNDHLFDDEAYWNNKYYERYISDIPFALFDSVVGYPNKYWKTYIAHPTQDNYYTQMNVTPAQYRRINMPILTITGAYDGDQAGALTFYRQFMQYASAEARERHYLIIGPWDHAGTRKPLKVQGGVTMGDSSLLDMNNLHWQWYNHTLRDSAKPGFLRDKVMYYVANLDRWKTAASLEEIGKEKQVYFLNNINSKGSGKQDSTVLQTEALQNSMRASYTFNPLLKDQVERITYYLPPFTTATEVSGFFRLDISLQTDVKDIDVKAEVAEVTADGKYIPLTSQTIRARYRESLHKEKLLIPGENFQLHFREFPFISRLLATGSRLRLRIYSPNSMTDQVNYCSGGHVAYETAKDAHTATVNILQDKEHASFLSVPFTKQ